MTVAMMLPTSLPLLAFFQSLVPPAPTRVACSSLARDRLPERLDRLCDGRPRRRSGHSRRRRAVALLEENVWVIPAATFVVAGLYQFSSLKYSCLTVCRSPALRHAELAGAPRRDALPPRPAPRSRVRRLLLGPDAVDVRRGSREHWLDARAERRDRDREERVLGTPSEQSAGRASDRRRSRPRARRRPRWRECDRGAGDSRQNAEEALLDAAERLLVDVGYAAITTRRLARRRGSTRGSCTTTSARTRTCSCARSSGSPSA